jgi:hypothetical protein
MFRRLCLFLLMIGLALPAAAAPLHCASAPIAASASDHHGMHHGERKAPLEQAPKHDCIGCIASFAVAAPSAGTAPPPVARQKLPGELHIARLTSGPDTPPPRA